MKIDSQRFVAFVLVISILAGIGMRYTALQPYLYILAPWTMALNAICLIGFDGSRRYKYVLFVIGVLVIGYGFSLCNAYFGLPYGGIEYGVTLGPLLRGAPVMMGVVWLVLVLESACFARLLFNNRWVATLLGTLLIVGIDLLVEPVAAAHALWVWADGTPPLHNYFAWGLIAFLFQYGYHTLEIKQGTRVSVYLLVAKTIFIIIL